jgi:UDP-2,4-diacetamido-2,4,6-trideoxy-beta-L-altropyranose hydrolase
MTPAGGRRVVVRADASIHLGAGHVARCLTLADALGANGARCTFLMRRVLGAMEAAVLDRGHAVAWLDAAVSSAADDASASASWLERAGADLIIVDHYDLDAAWEQKAVSATGARLLVIDDLADRSHDADLLLDQNLGRQARDYATLVPARTRVLTGPRYALLRPQFAAARPVALARRGGALARVVISMGGIDRDNATAAALETAARVVPAAEIDVVLGAQAPWRAEIDAQARRLGARIRVHSAVDDMASLMTAADLAIGAAGGTAWERCCLGLPAVVQVLAANQRPGALALQRAGAARVVDATDPRADSLESAVQACVSIEVRSAMSAAAAAVCDGAGVTRVSEALRS